MGDKIASGRVRVIPDPNEMDRFQPGEVLVTRITDPDWEPIMKLAAAIVTDRGGRTSHAAIVSRELGIPAVVGTEIATQVLKTGTEVTVSTAEGEVGRVYEGKLKYRVEEIDPEKLPRPRTKIMLNVGNPEEALKNALLPSDGVGLLRMEFVFASWVGVHPLALIHFDRLPIRVKRAVAERTRGYEDKTFYFVDKLSQGYRSDRGGVLAAAGDPALFRLQDPRVRGAFGRGALRAQVGKPHARLAGGEPLLPPRLQGGVLARARRRPPGAGGVRA